MPHKPGAAFFPIRNREVYSGTLQSPYWVDSNLRSSSFVITEAILSFKYFREISWCSRS